MKQYRFRPVIAAAAIAVLLLTGMTLTSCKKNDVSPTVAIPTEPASATPDQATVIPTSPTVPATPTTGLTQATVGASSTQAPSAADTPEETFSVQIKVPAALQDVLAASGYTAEEICQYGCRQLITVSSSASDAEIRFYRFGANAWNADESLTCSGYVGHNGVTSDMHEGGMATPFGLYSISEAFYFNDPPATGLPTFRVTDDTYWVDDPESKYYNRRVSGTADRDWSSAEHMIDYPDTYEYGFVIDYNTAAEYGKGSAIFFHIKYEPTYGCVATNRESVLSYLAALDAAQNPYILIV